MPNTGTEASGNGPGALKIALISGVIGVLGIVIGAVAGPVVTKLLTEKPEIPGAPTTRLNPSVTLNGYTLTQHVEVANRTTDPFSWYEPLNVDTALTVRPGDTVIFILSCSIVPNDGNAKLSTVGLVSPSGLNVVYEPILDAKPVPTLTIPGGRRWAWDVTQHSTRNIPGVQLIATVAVNKPAYLTVNWHCTADIPDHKEIPGHSRAILKAEP